MNKEERRPLTVPEINEIMDEVLDRLNFVTTRAMNIMVDNLKKYGSIEVGSKNSDRKPDYYIVKVPKNKCVEDGCEILATIDMWGIKNE